MKFSIIPKKKHRKPIANPSKTAGNVRKASGDTSRVLTGPSAAAAIDIPPELAPNPPDPGSWVLTVGSRRVQYLAKCYGVLLRAP